MIKKYLLLADGSSLFAEWLAGLVPPSPSLPYNFE
jgi:hypothetical protein